MFGAFFYPYMGKKGKSLAQKSREAGIVAGLISLIYYTVFAVLDIGFLQFSFQSRMVITIKVSLLVMFGAGFISYVSIDKEKI